MVNLKIPENIKQFIDTSIPVNFHHIIYKIDDDDWNYLIDSDGIQKIISSLKNKYKIEDTVSNDEIKYKWVGVSLFYRYYFNQYHNAIAVLASLYNLMIEYQIENKKWIHKGLPLVFIRDFHMLLHNNVLAKRFALLTLCEDSIGGKMTAGKLKKNEAGIYSRLTFYHGMSDDEIENYFSQINELYDGNNIDTHFPEWILQNLNSSWLVEFPTASEQMIFTPNILYIKYLFESLHNDSDGKRLELLAEYILSIIPGFRTYRRKRTPSTDYDIFCAIEGNPMDFRSELGRYMICESKNWNKPADFTTIAKFCNVLDSVKCKSGIIFSKNGVSGEGNEKYAQREILKVYQRNGIIVLVIDEQDLQEVANGNNFITIVRNKYEKIRFDFSN